MSIESQLREALTARADEAQLGGPASDPYARVSGAIVADRRRRRTAALAGVAAVAALAVAIPTVAGGLGRDTTTPARRTRVVVPGPQDPRWSSIATWPTRGSLAEDADFLRSFREVVGDGAVVYAGDIEGDRVVVAWSRAEDGSETGTVYAGNRGAAASSLETISSVANSDDSAIVVRRDTTPDGWLLLLAPPAVTSAEVSPTVGVRLDGTVTRAWRKVPLRDGTAVTDLRDAPISLNRVRVGSYDGGVVTPARRAPVEELGFGFCGNCKGQEFIDHAEVGTSDGVAHTFGVGQDVVSTTTLVNAAVDPSVLAVSGFGDLPKNSTGRIWVGLSRLPGGQVVRTVDLGAEQKDGGGMSTSLEEGVPLDASTAEQRPVVLHGTTSDGNQTRYQVFAPQASSVQVVSSAPSLYPDSARVPVVNGSAVLTTPVPAELPTYRVLTFDADGAATGSWPLDLPNLDDPYDLRP
jgi:hypothetical protein